MAKARIHGKSVGTKLGAGVLTAFVLVLLVLAGPAEAFSVSLDVDDSAPEKGEVVTYTAEVDMLDGEAARIDQIALELSGPESVKCVFDIEGNKIDGCSGATIRRVSAPSYGYGYAFGYGYGYGYTGKVVYEIELDTGRRKIGRYDSKIIVTETGGKTSVKGGPQINIKEESRPSRQTKVNIESCNTQWQCSDWSLCSSEGIQVRTCEKVTRYCSVVEPMPAVIQMCDASNVINLSGDRAGDVLVLNDSVRSERSNGGLSSITGAVVGVGDRINETPGAWGVVALLIGCIIMTIILLYVLRTRY